MQADRGCDKVPPTGGGILNLPAGGTFQVELAVNQAFTTLSWDGSRVTDWPDGDTHPEDWHGPLTGEGCLVENPDGKGGALHTQNQASAAGTAFAISYNSDISNVTMENLVVFTTAPKYDYFFPSRMQGKCVDMIRCSTPWKRIATYAVPRDLPPCPARGCYCAWLWVPKGCEYFRSNTGNNRALLTRMVSGGQPNM